MKSDQTPNGPQYVRRSPKHDASRFARIDNALLQNGALSFRARGLLAFVLSKPPGWKHSAENLANPIEKKPSIRTALRELAIAGHARLEKRRDARGRVRHEWSFSEIPASPAPSIEKQHSAPSAGLPSSVGPSDGKTALFETTVRETTVLLAPADAAAGEPARKPHKPKAPRQRNPLLDSLAAIDGSDPRQVTGSAWSGIAKALKEIREVSPDVTPPEISRRSGNYALHFRDATISPHALAKHWARCDKPPGRPAASQRDEPLRMISA